MSHKRYTRGTHRERTPEETLALIGSHVAAAGVSRCADVTGLDDLGIPVFAAIRPAARLVQVANGKGISMAAARVSALMEAIEHAAAEREPATARFESLGALRRSGVRVVDPPLLPGFVRDRHFSDELRVAWIEGTSLRDGGAVWIPASAVYALEPSLYEFTSNGLASGNSVVEATLHAVYEIVERHTLSLLVEGDVVDFAGCEPIDIESIGDDVVRCLLEELATRVEVRLLRLDVEWPLHTFMAVLLDPRAFAPSSTVSVGYGAHLSPAVAATRALTEAAQGRLTFIHGAREDLPREAYLRDHRRVYETFAKVEGDVEWSSLADTSTENLDDDLASVLRHLERAEFGEPYRAVLQADDIAVVKVLIPGALNVFPL